MANAVSMCNCVTTTPAMARSSLVCHPRDDRLREREREEEEEEGEEKEEEGEEEEGKGEEEEGKGRGMTLAHVSPYCLTHQCLVTSLKARWEAWENSATKSPRANPAVLFARSSKSISGDRWFSLARAVSMAALWC